MCRQSSLTGLGERSVAPAVRRAGGLAEASLTKGRGCSQTGEEQQQITSSMISEGKGEKDVGH